MKKTIVTAVATLLIGSISQAQVIRVSPEAFPIGAPAADLPIAPLVPKAPPVDLSLSIRSGDLLSARLIEWARKHGYVMTWTAPEFRGNSDLRLSMSFDDTLKAFGEAMKRNGVHLQFEIFQNNAIRVQEVK